MIYSFDFLNQAILAGDEFFSGLSFLGIDSIHFCEDYLKGKSFLIFHKTNVSFIKRMIIQKSAKVCFDDILLQVNSKDQLI